MGDRDVSRPREPSRADGPREKFRGRGNGAARASVRGLFALGAVLVAVYLIAEYRVHTIGVLPYLLLLACPILHLFWHGRHRDHVHGDGGRPPGRGSVGVGRRGEDPASTMSSHAENGGR